ncbi:MAG: hypothetical protein HY057_12225 [Rhodospirillales bacterium]|nr:hypothetical protein [Rhodospirillales bacterium]
MTSRLDSYKPRHYGTAKEAAAALVKAAGGIEAAASQTRVKPSTMHAYTDPAAAHVHMPIDVALALQRATGCHDVTRFLAADAGLALFPLHPDAAYADFAVGLARLGKEASTVFAEGAEFLQDGRLDSREASTWLRDFDALLHIAARLREQVAHRVEAFAERAGFGRKKEHDNAPKQRR